MRAACERSVGWWQLLADFMRTADSYAPKSHRAGVFFAFRGSERTSWVTERNEAGKLQIYPRS